MSRKGDIRRHPRTPRSGPVQLTWRDPDGNAQVSPAVWSTSEKD
jgi:hypothetical protein